MNNVSRRNCLLFAAIIVTMASVAATATADTIVSLEVVATDRFAIAKAQEWARELGDMGFSRVRIRLADRSERPQPEIDGEPGDRSRRVTGVLTSGNVLVLPGGKFRRGDSAEIKAWIKSLDEPPPDENPPAAFGLTAEELVDLHTMLAKQVTVETKGEAVASAANALVRELPVSVNVSAEAKQRIAAGEPIRDELQGLSTGTALAAILRPLGLGLAPSKQGDRVALVVDDFRKLPESWPIGWPPTEKDVEIVPKLLEFLPVEINDTPVADTVGAIAGRLDLPVLYDHNGMARHRIDPTVEKVNIPETRTYYLRVLDRALIPAGLKGEVRVDEADKPFYWIGTIKK